MLVLLLLLPTNLEPLVLHSGFQDTVPQFQHLIFSSQHLQASQLVTQLSLQASDGATLTIPAGTTAAAKAAVSSRWTHEVGGLSVC
jgi:hypothetical protein